MLMKSLLVLSMVVPTVSVAQTAGVRVDGISAEENTTIEIKKNDRPKSDKQFEISEGTEEVAGDAAPLIQEARKNWKAACADWKKEFKDLNKDNQILSLSCGSMICTTVTMENTCKSQAKYKLRVQIKQ